MQLHQSVLFISIILMLLVLFVFIYVARNASEKLEYAPIQKKGYKFRAILFWCLTVLGVLVTVTTLNQTPYASQHNSQAKTVIDVVGHQWYWEVSQSEVSVGEPVVFSITSADVNHGLGIYDNKLVLVAQAQAMPGYTNRLEHTFSKPGVYKFLCLEYCGLAHHAMAHEITVIASTQ